MSQWREKGRLLTPSDFRTLALATLVRREERLTVFKTHKTQTHGRLSTLQVSTSVREHKEPVFSTQPAERLISVSSLKPPGLAWLLG